MRQQSKGGHSGIHVQPRRKADGNKQRNKLFAGNLHPNSIGVVRQKPGLYRNALISHRIVRPSAGRFPGLIGIGGKRWPTCLILAIAPSDKMS